MPVDRAARALALRGLNAFLPEYRDRNSRGARQVLLLRHDRIGDMLMSMGLIREVGRLRDTMLDVIASPTNASVLTHSPEVRTVHVLSPGVRGILRLCSTLRRQRYDVVLDGLVLKPSVNSRTALLLLAAGAPMRVGIGGRENDFLYTHRVRPGRSDAHHVEYLAMLAQPLGVEPTRAVMRPEITFTTDERDRADAVWRSAPGSGSRLLVNVSAGQRACRWPDERTVAVLRRARERRPALRIIITGIPEERASCNAVAGAVGRCVTHAMTLREALALVATSDVVFTPDTGIAHAAASTDRPVVVMRPAVTSAQFVPYRARGRVVVADGDDLTSLSVAPVIAALDEVLAELAGE